METITRNRLPKVEIKSASLIKSEGVRTKRNYDGLQRSSRSLFSIRQEPEEGGREGVEGNYVEGNCQRNPLYNSYDGSKSTQSGVTPSSWTREFKNETEVRRGKEDKLNQPLRSTQDEEKKCFLDKERYCSYTCKAYQQNMTEVCSILSLINKIEKALKTSYQLPLAPPPRVR